MKGVWPDNRAKAAGFCGGGHCTLTPSELPEKRFSLPKNNRVCQDRDTSGALDGVLPVAGLSYTQTLDMKNNR